MLSDYPVRCPYPGCEWKGYLIPTGTRGGKPADVPYGQRGWFRCQGCGRDHSALVQGESLKEIQLEGELEQEV